MSFKVVFVISSDSAPPDGKLVGDILYVNAPDGYRNIVHKVKHMMGLVSAHNTYKSYHTYITYSHKTHNLASLYYCSPVGLVHNKGSQSRSHTPLLI